jgi:hypothetical protein
MKFKTETLDRALKEFQDAFKVQDEVAKKIMGAFRYE